MKLEDIANMDNNPYNERLVIEEQYRRAEDPIEKLFLTTEICGYNHGMRETHKNKGMWEDTMLKTRSMAKMLAKHFNKNVSEATIRDYRKRYEERFYHYCIKWTNSDYSRLQIYYTLEAFDIFKELITKKKEEIIIIPDPPKIPRSSNFGDSSDDPFINLLSQVVETAKWYYEKKGSLPEKVIKKLENKFKKIDDNYDKT